MVMNKLSDGQKTYLKQQNKHRWIVRVSRIAILLIFLFFVGNFGNNWSDRFIYIQQPF